MLLEGLRQSSSTFFNSRHTEQGAKIAKARHEFFMERFLSLKTSNKFVFKSSNHCVILKKMLIMDFEDLLMQFFLASFRPSPKLPRHTYGPFTSHCTPVENRWSKICYTSNEQAEPCFLCNLLLAGFLLGLFFDSSETLVNFHGTTRRHIPPR
jgi:hypothetical protein